jgi:GxxExxY protein
MLMKLKTDLQELDPLSNAVIGCIIEVHRELGPGLLEGVYHKALCVELKSRGIPFESEKPIAVNYKGQNVGEYRADLVVDGSIVVELKSVERDDPLFTAQLLSYMKLGGFKLGLLVNFNKQLAKDGIKRMVL